MQIVVSPTLTVSGQIEPSDVPDLAAQGFKTIVTARNDNEVPGQTPASEIAKAADAAGIAHAFIPVTGGVMPSTEDARAFSDAEAAGPVLAYCGAGPRAVVLASAAAAQRGDDLDEVIARARNSVGIDLEPARPYLEMLRTESQ